MKRATKHALALALLCALASCRPGPVSWATPTRSELRDYLPQLKRWTRHGHVLHDFDEALTIDATLHGPAFRGVYVEKWIAHYQLRGAEAEAKRAALWAEVGDTWEVHLESSSHFFDVDNFKPDKKLWRLALITDGKEVEAREVIIDKMRREVQMELYPHATPFTRGWRVRFPRTLADGRALVDGATRSVTLRIAGPQGHADLVWPLE